MAPLTMIGMSGPVSGFTGVVPAAGVEGEDISTSFYEISNRIISITTNDYSGAYDVGEVQTDFTGSGRVYIGVKITASTTYYNDIAIAGVQVISGSTLVASWIFNTNVGGSGSGWQTHTTQISGSSSVGFPVTPAAASGYSYVNMSTSTNISRFSWGSATGSNYTGASDGIANTYKLSTESGGNNTLASVGNGQVSQAGSTYYAFREASGSTRYSGTLMRSPAYTFSGGEYIRVIHLLAGYAGTPMNVNDSLYVAVY